MYLNEHRNTQTNLLMVITLMGFFGDNICIASSMTPTVVGKTASPLSMVFVNALRELERCEKKIEIIIFHLLYLQSKIKIFRLFHSLEMSSNVRNVD